MWFVVLFCYNDKSYRTVRPNLLIRINFQLGLFDWTKEVQVVRNIDMHSYNHFEGFYIYAV